MQARRKWLWALGLSFGVYGIPLLSAHWLAFLGEKLVRELVSERQAVWILADVAVAVGLQAVLFCWVWWLVRRGPGIAVAGCIAALIPLTWAANVAYMVAVPSYFLIERDDAGDLNPWVETCTAQGYSLDPSPAGIGRAIEQHGETVVRSDSGEYGMLRMPDCRVERYPLPTMPIAPGVHKVLPDGSLVYTTMERGAPGQRFWYLRRGQTKPAEIVAPSEASAHAIPLVSDDGEWVAWQTRDAGRMVTLRIDPIGSGTSFRFTHELLQQATLVTLGLDMKQREVVINRDLATFAQVRLDDGVVVWGPLRPNGIAAQSDTFRYLDGQWLGWDAYVEHPATPKVAWSARGGVGEYRVPRGRSVTSAALDPEGRYVAVSTTTSLNIGSFPDTVLVLRTIDGTAVIRKTLPRYARSPVAFLSGKYFAYSDIQGNTGLVRLLQMKN